MYRHAKLVYDYVRHINKREIICVLSHLSHYMCVELFKNFQMVPRVNVTL